MHPPLKAPLLQPVGKALPNLPLVSQLAFHARYVSVPAAMLPDVVKT